MTTFETVRRIIARVTRSSEADITPELALKDIKADSLHWLQIVVGVEEALDIEIDFDRMREMTTVGDFVSYVDGCRKQ